MQLLKRDLAVVLVNDNEEELTMEYGAKDFFWRISSSDATFTVTRDDSFLFDKMTTLFTMIDVTSSAGSANFDGHHFKWISEVGISHDVSYLDIDKDDDNFTIKITSNTDTPLSADGGNICFRINDSSNDEIVMAFVELYFACLNYLRDQKKYQYVK